MVNGKVFVNCKQCVIVPSYHSFLAVQQEQERSRAPKPRVAGLLLTSGLWVRVGINIHF